jgi:F0F1-type ATP synthase epsilon subunit
MKNSASSTKLNVIARAPFHKYYDGPAMAVSASNQVGKFDILPGHADFFSVMVPGEVVIQTDTDIINFAISNGIINVRGDQVMLFVNI